MRKTIWLLAGLLLFTMGCPSGDSTDEEEIALLQDLQFNYHQGLNNLYFSVQVESSFLSKKLQAVQALYFGFDTTQTADTLALNDAGITGDIISDDDVFSIKVSNDSNYVTYVLEPADTGKVYIKYLAQFGTVIKEQMTSFKMGNQGPRILSVSMPDTMRRPSGDSVVVGTIVVSLTDPDGHEDVQTCYLMFQKPDSTFSSGSPISLYDDGNEDFSMYLWDEVANDGKYSRYIIIDSSNPLGTYTSYFYARDYSGILSEPYITKLVVQ
ncbi:MAG TPA: hypothetical protein EYN76_02920 [Candidatus Marinimicrobia bacterium]|nr:hypothetical protein [Candidatus Neomarinimicrobiota bacterium]HIB61434.1 hypothetical protein [Candidatus Neomarinimicrobiota bacterium]